MRLIEQLQDIRFTTPYPPNPTGVYIFRLTEIYPGLEPISYQCMVGDWRLAFLKNAEGVYQLVFHDNPFEQYEERAAFLGCELTIYPAFGNTESKNAAA